MSKSYTKWLKQTIAEMQEHAELFPGDIDADHGKVLKALRIALASLEAEAVGEVVLGEFDDSGCHPDARAVCIAADGQADWENFKGGTRLYTAPPAPVSVPDEMTMADAIMEIDAKDANRWTGRIGFQKGWNACRDAMFQEAK